MLISLENIDKHYKMGNNIVKALDNVSLMVEKGEFIAVIGQSGSGKSTLMNIIGCLDTPTCGKYLLENCMINCVTRLNSSHDQISYAVFCL